MSFESGKAVVWAQDVASGQRRAIANFRGSNSAPAWSPDGARRWPSRCRATAVSQIYLMDRDGGNLRRITQSTAIDTEPVFTPDGKQIYFVSDRGGSPQIYRMAASGGNAERVTFNGSYNISPALSPDGRTLAYVNRNGSAFKVMTHGSRPAAPCSAVSDTVDDESPSFAPNGKLHHLRHARAGARRADDHHARRPDQHAAAVFGRRRARAGLGTFRSLTPAHHTARRSTMNTSSNLAVCWR